MKRLFKSYMRMFRSGGYYDTDNEHGCLTPAGHLSAFFKFGDPEKYLKGEQYELDQTSFCMFRCDLSIWFYYLAC